MSETDELRDPLEILAAEFMERQRSGEPASIAEYTAKHPELAADIEELFPTIAMMEQLKAHKEQESGARVSLGGVRLERLGDFLIVGEIGRGGMGIVYEAFQESLGRHVAVKVLPRQSLLDSTQLQRFHREAQTAAKLHHTNIVPIFGVGEHEGYHYIVMQLIRGAGLDAVIAELRQKGLSATNPLDKPHKNEVERLAEALVKGRLWRMHEIGSPASGSLSANTPDDEDSIPRNHRSSAETPPFSTNAATEVFNRPAGVKSNGIANPSSDDFSAAPSHRFGASYWRSAAMIGMQVADALHYAHGHHTLHRDIKPANLLLDPQGVVWITDFGLAKAMEQDNVTQAGGMVGTLRYMPPEQFSGKADARSDIYNLGLTLYELLTLRPAFEDSDRSSLIHKITHDLPPNPRKLNASIPRDLETIVLKAIAREPRDRYQTAGDMASDLQCFLEDRPIRARRSSLPERLWRWSRRNRAVAGLAVSILLMLIAIAVTAGVGYWRTAQANIEEKKQRNKAEATSALAINALDNIFQKFAPDRTAPASSWQMVSDTGEKISVPVQPVLSKEAASLLESMLVFYDQLSKQIGDDARLQRKVAEANRRVGDIRQRLGQNEESKAAYLRAAAIYAKLAESAVDKSLLNTEIARIHNELGTIYCAMNQPKAGYDAYRDSLEMLKKIADDSSAPPESQYELARAYYFLGKMPGDFHGPPLPMMGGPPGPPPGSRDEDAFPGSKPPPGSPPDEPPLGPPFGPPHDEPPPGPPPGEPFGPPHGPPPGLEDGEHDSRNPPPIFPMPFPDGPREAKNENLEKAVEILERLVAGHTDMPDYRHLLARCYREMSQQWFTHGSISAPDAAKKATDILQNLVEKYPDVPDYRYDLSKTYLALETSKMFSWKPADKDARQESLEVIEKKVLPIAEQLVAENPNVPDYAVSLMQIRLQLGYMLWESDPSSAENYLKKALETQSMLVRHFPGVSPYQFGMAFIYDSLAGFYQKQKRLPDAQSMLKESIAVLKEALKKMPDAHPIRGILARNYMTLADLLRQTGDTKAAEEAVRQAESLHPGPKMKPRNEL